MSNLGGYEYPLPLKRAVRPWVLKVRYRGLEPTDVMLASYPRSGSTWLRFLLAESLLGRAVEWDEVNRTIPYVGQHRSAPALLPDGGRLAKTHDPRVGPCSRAILIVRDPRDVVVSEYRWFVRGGYAHDLETFLRAFLDGSVSLFGSWSDNTRFWLDSPLAAAGNLHVIRFENLRGDTAEVVRTALRFAGADTPPEAVDRAIANNTIERSREKEGRAERGDVRRHGSGESFVGDGAVEGWRSKLTPEQTRRVEQRTADLLERLGYEPVTS